MIFKASQEEKDMVAMFLTLVNKYCIPSSYQQYWYDEVVKNIR
jgi:hypothetical protein